MTATINWTDKTPPDVKIIRDRREFEKLFGREAPPPDLLRPPQYWALESLPATTRRYDYMAIALEAGATPILMAATDDPSPERRAFYAEYGMKEVPVIESRQVTRGQALAVNLPWDVNPAGDTVEGYSEWLHSGIQESPILPLLPNEAFAPPTLMGRVGIVNMAVYRAENPVKDGGSFTAADRVIAAESNAILKAIARKLGVVLSTGSDDNNTMR